MKSRILVSLGILVGAWITLNLVSNSEDTCVNLYVDYGSDYPKVQSCVSSSSDVNALVLLKQANLKIEGTQKYGNAVVCRVNGIPNASVEKCEAMPPENAYWAILVKKKQILPFPTNEWGWAQVGVNALTLKQGDSLGLVFVRDGKVVYP
jgi:hypothetical protein